MKIDNIKELLTEFQMQFVKVSPLGIDDIRQVISEDSNNNIPVIFPSSWVNGLGILRGLGREGIRSIVMDHQVDALCFYSKFAIPYQLPCDPIMEPGAKPKTLNALLTIGKMIQELGKSAVFLLTDSENFLDFILKNYSELEKVFVYSADYHKQKLLEDKKQQLKLAADSGIAIPKSFFISTEKDFKELSKQVEYPLIIKPRGGKEFYREFGQQAIRVLTPDACKNTYEKVRKYDLIFQEEIQGPDENLYTLGSYMDHNSEPKAIFTGKKIKSNRGFGTCEMGISCDASQLQELGLRFLRNAAYWGASQVEFKKDARDGKYKLIEINNRLWKWHSLAIDSGVNIPYIQYLDAIGEKIDILPIQENGIRWWMSLHDIATTVREQRFSGSDFIEYIREIDLDFVDGIGARDDPLPFLVNLFKFMWV